MSISEQRPTTRSWLMHPWHVLPWIDCKLSWSDVKQAFKTNHLALGTTLLLKHNCLLNLEKDWEVGKNIFTSDHHTFCIIFKVRRHFIGCIKHDMVIDLCSELLILLHPSRIWWKVFGLTWGSNQAWAVNSTPGPECWLFLSFPLNSS